MEENTGLYLYDPVAGKDFSDKTQKPIIIKEQNW